MYVLATLLLLFLAVVTMAALRLSRSSVSFAWLTAVLGALVAWISILFWQIDLPHLYSPSLWQPTSLFNASPELLADSYAWIYALSLTALAGAVVLTSPVRTSALNPVAWAGTLALTILGLLAVLADNPLTLVLAWAAIDLVEFAIMVRTAHSASLSERTVISFSIRAIGTGIALWASVVSAINGQTFLFENASAKVGIILLLAVGLRLGVLPLHLSYKNDSTLRRGFGTTLRLTAAASSLILLARLPFSALDPAIVPIALAFVALAAFYSAWRWFSAPNELIGRPYWIIGMSALSLAATLRGNSAGSAAWGVAMLLFGGISFLYSARQIWYTRILAGLGILLMAAPLSLTASGWMGAFPQPLIFWPLFLTAHVMLLGGYIRHLFRAGETSYFELPVWAKTAYPLGLGILVVTALVVSLWGWPGALQVGVWSVPVFLLVLSILVGFALFRFRRFFLPALSSPSAARLSRLSDLQDVIARALWTSYRILGRLFTYVANLLEGDGGLLWTLLLLVLFITILRGR
ncbi:MAG: hypothetical protein NT121_25265 [Chloroflexi bacterium]|nr:hypothetical protein [Chloroflexota bacterium]